MNKRTPRPRGYTELANIHTKDNNTDTYNACIDHLIHHYIHTGFRYCGIPMDIETYSNYTGIDRNRITQAIINYEQGAITLGDTQEQQEEFFRALYSQLVGSALADRNRALQQYSVLASAQGHTYVPFISGEVNRALKLTQDSTANMLQVFKALGGDKGPSIIINNGPTTNEQNNYLTVDGALELLNQKAETQVPLVDDPKALEALQQEYIIDQTPEVVASRQQGLNTDKEGLNIKQLAHVHDGLVNDMDEPHMDRRAKEIDEDLEADEV